MRMSFNSARLRAAWFTAALMLSLGAARAKAQITSVSAGIGDPLSGSLSDETQTSGFDSTFDTSTNNLTNPTLHTDISDPTHSQLLGSALTPLDGSYVSGSVDTVPQTGVLTDAQTAVGALGGSSGSGSRNQIFTAGGFTSQNAAGRAAAINSLGLASMRASFGVGATSRAMLSGTGSSSVGRALSFSGEGIPGVQTPTGVGATQTTLQLNKGDRAEGFYATDPVLSGSTSGYEADLQLYGDLPLPSEQTGTFFAESSGAAAPQYQYDDGQTPPLYAPNTVAGRILGSSPEYGISPFGFPDSTRGLAGLRTEASGAMSPLEQLNGPGSSSLASNNEGLSFSPTLHLIPNLQAPPEATQVFRFEAVERREQEQRILHGMSISEASEAYKQDVRKYRRQVGRALPRRPAANIGTTPGQGSGQGELMGAPSIR